MLTLKSRLISNQPSILYNPWLYFLVFLLINSVLAYGSLNFKINLYIALIGWVFPMILGAFFFSKIRSGRDSLHEESISAISTNWWFLIGILSILPRLYILLNSSLPNPDESLFGFVSLELSKMWKWRFFFTFAQAPPIFNWSAAIFFKWFVPSIFSMRLFIFSLSIFTIFLVYKCGRNLFSNSLMFSYFFLSAFSFWPLYISKFFEPLSLLPIFEISSFGALGAVLNSTNKKSLSLNGWWLGLATGSGFWVVIQWPLVALMILAAVLYRFKKKILTFYQLWIPFFLFFIPFCYFSLAEKNGEHIKTIFAFSSHQDIFKQLNDSFSNWTALFWGCDLQNSYGPIWGGMLNPISGALFFIGIFELIHHRKFSTSRWIFTSLFAFMIPGLITKNFEVFRNEQLEPLLLFISAIGIQALFFHTEKKYKNILLIVILFFSAGLDAAHILKTYQIKSQTGKNYSINITEFSKAILIFKKTIEQNGPGEIFWGLTTDVGDPTLEVATYSFNAAENPTINDKNIQWVAFITNANYKPYLSDQYPNAQFFWLGLDTFWNQGGLMLVLISKNEANLKNLNHWREVNDQFHYITNDYLLNPNKIDDSSELKKILEIEKNLNHDRFLESVFYEKLIYFQRKNPDLRKLIELLKLGEQKGYPAAHLLVTEGLLWRAEENYPEAEKAFKKAIHSRLNLTDAQKNLEILSLLKKAS